MRHEKAEPGKHPLDIYFRTPPDSMGHVPHPHWLETGHIHLRMDALSGKDASEKSVARLLFHEATHKWANTQDICYKWDTIAQKNKHTEWEVAAKDRTGKGWQLTRQIQDGVQPAIDRGAGKKPLMSMAKEGVVDDSWALNADSYAWAAYRLWKKAAQEIELHSWED